RELNDALVLRVVRVAPDGRSLLVVHVRWRDAYGVNQRLYPSDGLPRVDNLVRVWDLGADSVKPRCYLLSDAVDAFFAADGSVITLDKSAKVWDVTRWQRPEEKAAPEESPEASASVPWVLVIGFGCILVGFVVLYLVDPYRRQPVVTLRGT